MDFILDNYAVTRHLHRDATAQRQCRVAARGRRLTWDDRLFLDYVTQYTLGYLLPDKEHNQCSICFTVSKPRTEFDTQQKIKGTSTFRGTVRGLIRCDIWMLESLVNWDQGKLLPRYEGALPCIMHHLMHVKQYLAGELIEIADAEYRYLGRGRDSRKKDRLVEMFKEHWTALSL